MINASICAFRMPPINNIIALLFANSSKNRCYDGQVQVNHILHESAPSFTTKARANFQATYSVRLTKLKTVIIKDSLSVVAP